MGYPKRTEVWECSDGQCFNTDWEAKAHEQELKPDIVIPYARWKAALDELSRARDSAWAAAKAENQKPQHEYNAAWAGQDEGKKMAYSNAVRIVEQMAHAED